MDINICGRRKLTINNKCYSIVGKKQDQILKFVIKKIVIEIFIKINNYNRNIYLQKRLTLKRKTLSKVSSLFLNHAGVDKRLDLNEFKILLKTIDFTINYIDIIDLIYETYEYLSNIITQDSLISQELLNIKNIVNIMII